MITELRILLSLLLVTWWLFALAGSANAQIIINEVYPNPSTGENEWLEIYNSSDQAQSLAQWSIKDQLTTPSLIYQFTDQVITAHSYLVIDLTAAKLNNSADGVDLINSDQQTIDTWSYDYSEIGKSWSRLDTNNHELALTQPTPGQPNQLPTSTSPTPLALPTVSPSSSPTLLPSPSPSPTITTSPSPSPPPTPAASPWPINALQPSEVMACPESDQNEWLEIKNISDQVINLSPAKLIDQSNQKRTINLVLNPYSLGVLEWNGSLLNNDGDSLILKDQWDREIFQFSLAACQSHHSFIYQQSTWQMTSTMTKGEPNLLTTASSSPTPSPSNTATSSANVTASDDDEDEMESAAGETDETNNKNNNSAYASAWQPSQSSWLNQFGLASPITDEATGDIFGEKTAAAAGRPAQTFSFPTPAQLTRPTFVSLVGGGLTLITYSSWKLRHFWESFN